MINVVRSTLFYMNPDEPVPVHSLSALSSPYQVILIFFLVLFCSSSIFLCFLSAVNGFYLDNLVNMLVTVDILPYFCCAKWLSVFILFVIPTHLVYFQRIIFGDMPTTFFFDLLRETDQEFVVRTGWFYRHDQHIHVPDPSIRVRPPCLPVGSPEVVSQFYF